MRALAAVCCILVLAGCAGNTTKSDKKAEEKPAVAYFKVDPGTAGKVSGKIAFTGKKPKLQPIRMDSEADCMKAHTSAPIDPSVIVNGNGTVRNVFVYIKTGLEGKTFEPIKTAVKFDQKGCMFAPRVLGVMTEQPVQITNSDTVTHNVHPLARKNREWNQGQQPGAEPLEREFRLPEVMIPVKCNVHAWMRSYIGVMPHPYFAVTGDDGTFELKNVPPGEYTVEAWHEKLQPQEQKVTVAPSGAVTSDFTFKGE
jgi:plastocyanin